MEYNSIYFLFMHCKLIGKFNYLPTLTAHKCNTVRSKLMMSRENKIINKIELPPLHLW
jgi:hypothetical protein